MGVEGGSWGEKKRNKDKVRRREVRKRMIGESEEWMKIASAKREEEKVKERS